MPKLRKFLLSLSGARPGRRPQDPQSLQDSPRWGMPELLGCAVLVIGGIAGLSVWLALTGDLGLNPLVAAAPALAGGLVVIVIERWLVSPVSRGGHRRFVRVIPRAVVAVLLGALISTPIVLRIFQPEINARITAINDQRIEAALGEQQHSSPDPQLAYWTADVANLRRVIATRGQAALNPATDPQLISLNKKLAAERALQRHYYTQWQCETNDGPGCGAGQGELAGQAAALYRQASAQVAALTRQIQQRKQQLSSSDPASRRARYQEATARLPAAEQHLADTFTQQGEPTATAGRVPRTTSGLSTRVQALGQLSSNDVAFNLALLLSFLLVLAIVCLPVTGRLGWQPAGYGAVLGLATARDPGRSGTAYRRRPGTAWASPRDPGRAGDPGSGLTAFSSADAPPGGGSGVSSARHRYLKGQCPERVLVGKPFSLLARITSSGPDGALLKDIDVPPEGRDVLLSVHAPGLRLLGDQRLLVRVPADGDSEPVMFELRADEPGPRSVSVTAWLGGNYLGELLVEIMAERDGRPGPHRDVFAEIVAEAAEGAVSLVVRYDPAQNAYRFEFRDEDNPDEVKSDLSYDPKPVVERLIAGLDNLARGRSGYSPAQAREYLENSGAGLWHELVPGPLREQFWDRQQRITQLTILADKDIVPWELLYPQDPGRDAGFLVEQFPVTRGVFRRRLPRHLNLRPARFVLPAGSLTEAQDEIDAMRQLLDPGQAPNEVISALTPLQELIRDGDFGLLHFACHNRFDPADGSSITMDNAQFTPTWLNKVAINHVLARSAPTVFINACRTAGFGATYNRLDGWASKFLEAGAAAFVGTQWAVSDGTAREFAQELYRQLEEGRPLGSAVMQARQVAASQLDDPTWLAYTVYGDPRATVSQGP